MILTARSMIKAAIPAILLVATVLTAGEKDRKVTMCWKLTQPVKFEIDAMRESLKKYPEMTGFIIQSKTKRQAAPNQTFFKMAWDEKYLYILVRCEFPKGASLTPSPDGIDTDVFSGDAIELVIDQDETKPYYLFGYNITGEGKVDRLGSQTKWNTNWQVKCDVRENVWTSLARIPFSSFGPSPKLGDFWPINFARHDMISKKFSVWCLIGDHYFKKRFMALLYFGDPGAENIASQSLPIPKTIIKTIGRGSFNPWRLRELCDAITACVNEATTAKNSSNIKKLKNLNNNLAEQAAKFKHCQFADIEEVYATASNIKASMASADRLLTKHQLDALFAKNKL